MNKTAITKDQREPTLASALTAAPRFGLKASESVQILREVFTAVSGWRKTGRQLRLKASTLDTYASALDHPLIDEARGLLGKQLFPSWTGTSEGRCCRQKCRWMTWRPSCGKLGLTRLGEATGRVGRQLAESRIEEVRSMKGGCARCDQISFSWTYVMYGCINH